MKIKGTLEIIEKMRIVDIYIRATIDKTEPVIVLNNTEEYFMHMPEYRHKLLKDLGLK